MNHDSEQPWYAAGLQFECTQCGHCCRGPGNVWISDTEIETMADVLGRSTDDFREKYTQRSGRRGLVLQQKRNQDCVFWQESRGCRVYTVRPRQCRTYPFWLGNLLHSVDWQSESRSCPGIGEGPLCDREAIESNLSDDGIPEHRTRLRTR